MPEQRLYRPPGDQPPTTRSPLAYGRTRGGTRTPNIRCVRAALFHWATRAGRRAPGGDRTHHVLCIRQAPPTRWALRRTAARTGFEPAHVPGESRATLPFVHRATVSCLDLGSNQGPAACRTAALPLSYRDVAGVRFERRHRIMSPVWIHSTTPAVGRPGLEPGTLRLRGGCSPVELAARKLYKGLSAEGSGLEPLRRSERRTPLPTVPLDRPVTFHTLRRTPGRIRTCDPLIRNQVRYPLRHQGMVVLRRLLPACPARDSNPQPPRSKRGASTNWTTRAWWTTSVSNRAGAACKAALHTCASPVDVLRAVRDGCTYRGRESNPQHTEFESAASAVGLPRRGWG
jgi:hypothetical protein